jgi:hypothetical protein
LTDDTCAAASAAEVYGAAGGGLRSWTAQHDGEALLAPDDL